MAEILTKPTALSVEDFIAKVEDPRRREDATRALALMKRATGDEAVMWGPAIVGFGVHPYTYANGKPGKMPKVAFSPRKTNITFYALLRGRQADELLARLGKHKINGGCLHINRLSDVDEAALEEIARL